MVEAINPRERVNNNFTEGNDNARVIGEASRRLADQFVMSNRLPEYSNIAEDDGAVLVTWNGDAIEHFKANYPYLFHLSWKGSPVSVTAQIGAEGKSEMIVVFKSTNDSYFAEAYPCNQLGLNLEKPEEVPLLSKPSIFDISSKSSAPVKSNRRSDISPKIKDTLSSDIYPLSRNLNDDITEILVKFGEDPSRVIFRAAGSGDVETVKKLIEYGVDPHSTNGEGNVVDFACRGDSVDMLEYLIDEMGLVPSGDPFSLLIHGTFTSHYPNGTRRKPFFDGIDFLLSRGYCFREDTIIRTLCYKPNMETLEFLINRGANITSISNPKFSDHSKGLLINLFCGPIIKGIFSARISEHINPDRELVNFAIKYGIDVNREVLFIKSKNPYYGPHGYPKNQVYGIYNTPLLIAIANNDIELVKSLISGGANVNFEGKEAVFHIETPFNNPYHDGFHSISPLKLAIGSGYKEIVNLLLANGANI